MTTISCVLRSGGEYRPEHVERLAKMLARHAPARDLEAVTDELSVGTTCRYVSDLWPGWWSKIEALRVPGPNLQLDLDVTIVGDLAPLLEAAKDHEFIASRDFWHPDGHGLNSSVMAWRGDMSWLADEFAAKPDWHMANYCTKQRWGDQAFIRDKLAEIDMQPVYWQDILPGAVLSYKCDVLKGADTSNARVIVYHGAPKPWELE